MSITIKHLHGPLKGKTQEFDDTVGTILVGRSLEAQVAYPEECIEVYGKHLKLVRGNDGQYAIELAGSHDVEIDGKPAETGMAVASGSVIPFGVGGPSFEVLLQRQPCPGMRRSSGSAQARPHWQVHHA